MAIKRFFFFNLRTPTEKPWHCHLTSHVVANVPFSRVTVLSSAHLPPTMRCCIVKASAGHFFSIVVSLWNVTPGGGVQRCPSVRKRLETRAAVLLQTAASFYGVRFTIFFFFLRGTQIESIKEAKCLKRWRETLLTSGTAASTTVANSRSWDVFTWTHPGREATINDSVICGI